MTWRRGLKMLPPSESPVWFRLTFSARKTGSMGLIKQKSHVYMQADTQTWTRWSEKKSARGIWGLCGHYSSADDFRCTKKFTWFVSLSLQSTLPWKYPMINQLRYQKADIAKKFLFYILLWAFVHGLFIIGLIIQLRGSVISLRNTENCSRPIHGEKPPVAS